MNPMNKVSQVRMNNPLLSGLAYAMIIMICCTLLLSFVLAFSDFSEQSVPFYVMVIHILSLLVGGFKSGKNSGEKGWYYGGLLGLIYFIIVLLVGYLGYDNSLSLNTLIQLGAAFAISALGGMFGVNARRK